MKWYEILAEAFVCLIEDLVSFACSGDDDDMIDEHM